MNHLCFDVIIIGAGVVGCALARELSRYDLSVAVLEKESDVAAGASGRNSGVVHAGFNNPPGSLKAKFCVEGNALFESACSELSVPFKRTGKLVTALSRQDLPVLEKLKKVGDANGVPGLKIIGADEIKRLEPGVSGIAALFSPSTAITNPFLFTVALAENAVKNGVTFFLEHEVTIIRRKSDRFHVRAGGREFITKVSVNSGGVHAGRVAGLAGIKDYRIYPCRGQYHILDKQTSERLKMPVYPVPHPGSGGLGVHLTPTVEGNILIGPSAEYIGDRTDYATTAEILEKLSAEARELIPLFSSRFIIRSFSGIRPKLIPRMGCIPPKSHGWRICSGVVSPGGGKNSDFIIKAEDRVPGLINLIGIESPGLTSAIPISRYVADIVGLLLPLKPREKFVPNRKGIVRFAESSEAERVELIAQDPDFGEIICRCESVSKKEIIEAVRNPLNVRTLAGIKYRARATTGRCQGGYCLTRIVEILRREFDMPLEKISLRGKGSTCFVGEVK